jgi:hypothetical protein
LGVGCGANDSAVKNKFVRNILKELIKPRKTLVYASKDVGLEINIEKRKYYVAASSPERKSKSGHKNSKQIV